MIYLYDSSGFFMHYDSYESLIITHRYTDLGDFEVKLRCTPQIINNFTQAVYVDFDESGRNDFFLVEKIQIQTDSENGDYLIVSGSDLRKILWHRIIPGQINVVEARTEEHIRNLINNNIGANASANRRISSIQTLPNTSLADTVTEQIENANLGEHIQQLCTERDWGWRFNNWLFEIYTGDTSKTAVIVFASDRDNIETTNWARDFSNYANVAYTSDSGEGQKKNTAVIGNAEGIDRYEQENPTDVSEKLPYEQVAVLWPGGEWLGAEGLWYYYLGSAGQIAWARTNEEGDREVTDIRTDYYTPFLEQKGNEFLKEKSNIFTFECKVIPGIMYTYKTDYNVGDYVTVKTEYGLSQACRVVEAVESWDENGYNVSLGLNAVYV